MEGYVKESILLEDKVNILHLSDLHFGIQPSGKYKQQYVDDRETALKRFFEDFSEIPEDWRPDIIAITGDIGWDGTAENYKEFAIFLDDLLQMTQLSIDRVVVCMGNHDKDDSNCRFLARPKQGNFSEIGVPLAVDTLAPYIACFCGCIDTLKDKRYEPLVCNIDVSNVEYLFGSRTILGIEFVILNSSWHCHHNPPTGNTPDEGSLKIGIELFSKVKAGLPEDGSIVVTMFHHPFEWLHCSELRSGADGATSLQQEIIDISQIILNGHEHAQQRLEVDSCHIYRSAALNSADTFDYQCRIIRINRNIPGLDIPGDEFGSYYYKNHGLGKKWHWVKVSEEPTPFDYRKVMKVLGVFMEQVKRLTAEKEFVKATQDAAKVYLHNARDLLARASGGDAVSIGECRLLIQNGENITNALEKEIELSTRAEELQGVKDRLRLLEMMQDVIAELINLMEMTVRKDLEKALRREKRLFSRLDSYDFDLEGGDDSIEQGL